MKKLPAELKKEWGQYVLNLEPSRPTLLNFDDWLRRQVRVAINYAAVASEDNRHDRTQRHGARVISCQRATLNTEVGYNRACISCGEQHKVDNCPLFLEKDVNKSAEFVLASDICFYCLEQGHKARFCRIAKQCAIDGCRMRFRMGILP